MYCTSIARLLFAHTYSTWKSFVTNAPTRPAVDSPKARGARYVAFNELLTSCGAPLPAPTRDATTE